MFLRHTKRKKDGKEHRYWSIVENRRIGGGRVVQRPLLYLGEINDSQELAWRKSIAILEEGALQPRTLSLFRVGLPNYPAAAIGCWPTVSKLKSTPLPFAFGRADTTSPSGNRPSRKVLSV